MEFFATCPTGFEHILAQELAALGIPRTRPLQGMVSFEGELACAYTACLWSRTASRVIAVVARGAATTADELYQTAYGVAWEDHLGPSASFAVDATGTNAQLRSTQFVAQRVKDAVSDRFDTREGTRPSVNVKNPDLTLVARVSQRRVLLGIDLAGAPLFRRGYERFERHMGLRPDYAAALLYAAGWNRTPSWNQAVFVGDDIMALMVEAAGIAAGLAPGLSRLRWGFDAWAGHDRVLWDDLREKARTELRPSSVPAFVAPRQPGVLSQAERALRAVGLNLALASSEHHTPTDSTVLLANLLHAHGEDLARAATSLAGFAQTTFSLAPDTLAAITRDSLVTSYLGTEPSKTVTGRLGKGDVVLSVWETPPHDDTRTTLTVASNEQMPVLVPASDQFASRLKKVARLRQKWAKREDVTCYRVYDADLPDYAVAIDLFEQAADACGRGKEPTRWLNISEYAPPKSIDPNLAQARLLDVLAIAPAVLGASPANTYLHVRKKSKGGSQYADDARTAPKGRTRKKGQAPEHVPLAPGGQLIDEGGLTFEVNFLSRHDCGIFLDHRDTRALLREMAKQTQGSKRFLNLFAYTGTATCYAADGGMRHTTTVDLSRPTLDWAKRNMARNGFVGKEHEYVQADVVRWVHEQRHTRNRWDLIFCDVPTFSNSSRMGKRSFDVQRDHVELLIDVSRVLTRNGSCVFSCNLRTFTPNTEALAKAGVVLEDITSQTIPDDFSRNQKIHHTYVMRRG